ncbi:SCO family protein [Aspergillus alliaceus]|uniref:SCO family protein n=1 Tax=Petromyces alliaceus TaxID=209559 RepID=UPI0012A4E961|nr:SCO1/SenC-domain-containing protein [Aspergillus alliaceus]KAB8236995.1 SCO1/SenC-domain-containing protein [Aspergillus alliaceus]
MTSSMRPLVQMAGRVSRSSLPFFERSALRTIPSQNVFLSLRTKTAQPAHLQVLRHNSLSSQRSFSTTTLRARARTMGQLKARNSTGPFSWKSALLFVITGGAMIIYFRVEKERLARKRVAEMSKGVGRPKVGGPFVLKDLNGNQYTEENLKGKYSFVYFGFTHCPDICPDELDKMAEIIDNVKEATKGENVFLPVFVTCDPVRDTPEVLRSYLQEFHKDIVGLTGTYEQVKHMCKQYRVYFSTPQNVNPGDDYLVDHSIYFYLMDPDGDFVECIGRQDTPESATRVIMEHINDWKREGKPLKKD